MIIGKVNDNKIDLTELSKWDNVIIYNKESKIVEQIEDSFSPKLVK